MDNDKLRALIEVRAYEFWEMDGQRNGRDQLHWLRAEKEIKRAQQELEEQETGPETSQQEEPIPEQTQTDDVADEQDG
jgi:Protein of unknown function (DUF2934)